jgi:hypothetical protein
VCFVGACDSLCCGEVWEVLGCGSLAPECFKLGTASSALGLACLLCCDCSLTTFFSARDVRLLCERRTGYGSEARSAGRVVSMATSKAVMFWFTIVLVQRSWQRQALQLFVYAY